LSQFRSPVNPGAPDGGTNTAVPNGVPCVIDDSGSPETADPKIADAEADDGVLCSPVRIREPDDERNEGTQPEEMRDNVLCAEGGCEKDLEGGEPTIGGGDFERDERDCESEDEDADGGVERPVNCGATGDCGCTRLMVGLAGRGLGCGMSSSW